MCPFPMVVVMLTCRTARRTTTAPSQCMSRARSMTYAYTLHQSSRQSMTSDHHKCRDNDALPMRWMSVESLETNKFTLKSDVWSYAIVLTELFTYGDSPYGDINTLILAYKVAEGLRPSQPRLCPPDLFALMQRCWHTDPDKRPSFQSIAREVTRMLVAAEQEMPVLRNMADLLVLAKTFESRPDEDDGYSREPGDGYAQESDMLRNIEAQRLAELQARLHVEVAPVKQRPLPAIFEDAKPTFDLPPGVTPQTQWYHGPISRPTAERLLLTIGRPSGRITS